MSRRVRAVILILLVSALFDNFNLVKGRSPSEFSTPRKLFEFLENEVSPQPRGTCERPPEVIDPEDDISKLSLWELLKTTENEMEIHTGDAILLLGNTGSGKSTIVQVVATNMSKLHVYETAGEDLIIVDEEQRIGFTTESRTLVPELVRDIPNSLYHYDCPGFSDNRGVNADITANYLLKKVTKHVSSVRLLFTVIQSAVKAGNDRQNFDYLAASATQMVRNLDKLEAGIGLLVTKADNYNSRQEFRTNETIIRGIIEFLNQYKEDQEKQINQANPEQEDVIRRKIKFVDILLKPDRIWFFRLADKCGPYVGNEFAGESKGGMTKLMKEQLKPVPSNESDFAFAVTDSTLLKVYGLYEELNRNVTSDMTSLVGRLKKAHFQSTVTIREFYKTQAWIQADFGNFTAAKNKLNASKSPSDFGEEMHSAIVTRGYDQRWGLDFKSQMVRINDYMNFFDEIAREGQVYPRESSKWRAPLDAWVLSLGKRVEWFGFLKVLQNTLSSYNFQKNDKPSQSPRDMEGLKALLKDQGGIITPSVIDIFKAMDAIVDQDVKIMWELVDEALEKARLNCNGRELVVTGAFVRVQEFTKTDGTYDCPTPPSVVKVLATRKLFFDRDIKPTLAGELDKELAIVVPQWEIVMGTEPRDYLVNLTGNRPNDPNGWVQYNWIRDPNQPNLRGTVTSIPWAIQYICDRKGAPRNGENGKNGKPGDPGFPGGNFIGMVESIIQGNHLKVMASGGDGSNGVNGGNGQEGQKGHTYEYNDWPKCHGNGPCVPEDCPKNPGDCSNSRTKGHFDKCFRKVSKVVDCRAEGCLGGRGGDGGNGGARGLGGYQGAGAIVNVGGSGNTGVQIVKNVGRDGDDGAGGHGGSGGYRGDGYIAGVRQSWPNCLCSWEDKKYITSSDQSPGGSRGTGGKETSGQQKPRQPSFTLNNLQLVLQYKAFAIPKQSDYFPNDFITRLETAPSVSKEHSPIRFAQELLLLEEINLAMRNDAVDRESLSLRMVPRYDSFLSRVDNYTESRGTDIADKDRKLLSLLYTTALNQLRIMQQVFGTAVVVDVSGYLETVEKRLQRYKEANTVVMVDEERERYKATFYQKIEQAMVFLVETVDPELNETYVEIEEVTDQLLVAIEKMIKEAEAQEQAYRDALDKMQKQMVLNDLFSIFKIGGTALSVLGGPVGGAVGGMIGTGVAIGEKLALDQGGSLRPPTPLPPSIQKYAKEMEAKSKATSQERQHELDTLIVESKETVKDNQEATHQLQPYIARLEEDKKALLDKGEQGTLKQFQDLDKNVQLSEKELIEQLEKRVDHLEKAMTGEGTKEEQEIAIKHGKKAIDSIKHVTSCVKIVSDLGFSVYNTHKNDRKEIARLSAIVDEAAEQVGDLKKYKEAVNGILVPFTDSVIQDLDAYSQQMANQSSVFLRVQRWNVQKTLRDYNYFLQDFSQAFPDIAKQYAFQVENLQEAMTLMIDLYDFIEQYNEQMQFADYIANINSPRAIAATLGAEEGKIYVRIELAMHASLILIEWDRVIQTFEQWVFPFENVFQASLKTSDVPNYLAPSIKNVKDVYSALIPEIDRRVKDLAIALKQYKSAIFDPMDAELILTEFNSNKVSTVPFYVWAADTQTSKIRELLLGNQVTFLAPPVYTYSLGMGAVKFTVAEIEPKSRNEKIQDDLSKLLTKLRVRMTHSGVSRYQYEDSVNEMVGSNLTIQYNFERDSQGRRLGKNSIYDKLENGDMILSPYTLWTVRLLKVHPELEFDFEEFAKMAPAVNLELIGKGSFVRGRGTLGSRHSVSPIPLYFLRQVDVINRNLVFLLKYRD